MSSTAIEFGLINTLRTENIVLDSLLCMAVPLFIQWLIAFVKGTKASLVDNLKDFFFSESYENYVVRVIETTKSNYSSRRSNWGDDDYAALLQRAISIYLADVLDLKQRNAKYELLEKPKLKAKSLGDDNSSGDGILEYESEDEEYYGEVDSLSVAVLPPMNEWFTVAEGVLFKHETAKLQRKKDDKEDKDEDSSERKKNAFRFKSYASDGTKRIDAFVDRAFRNYQEMERRKLAWDESRYFYIQQSKPFDMKSKKATDVTYKRYELADEKTFENLFFQEKEDILQLLDNFTRRKGKFAVKGFPHKLGLLLHGPPGTGKTSLIKAIAQHTKRDVVSISLGSIETNEQLMDALFDDEYSVEGFYYPIEMSAKDVVFVIEDIDCASPVVRARPNESDKPGQSQDGSLMSAMIKTHVADEKRFELKEDTLSLAGLLNALDGVIDCPGRIVIMTSNHPEKLDPALIRPGRINKKLLLGYMNCSCIQQMIEYYCSSNFTAAQQEQLSKSFERSHQCFTPAEIEELCAEHNDVDSVLEGFQEFAGTH